MNLIEKILKTKEVEVARMKRAGFVESCRAQSPFVIAEVKPQSPSGRVLIEENEVEEVVAVYSQHAAAISVLCDREFFGGGYDLLKRVAGMTDLPLLAKEFFVDRRQVYAAAGHGASAILLIPALISEEKCLELLEVALAAGLDVLLEFHQLADVQPSLVRAVAGLEDRVLIGVNNRDLRSLEMDMSTTARLMPELKRLFGEKHLYVAESGIENGEMAKELRPFVDGFLIGTGLLQAADRVGFFNDLK